jgi:hypothetical protein
VGEEISDTLDASVTVIGTLVETKFAMYFEWVKIGSGTDGIVCELAGLTEILLRNLLDPGRVSTYRVSWWRPTHLSCTLLTVDLRSDMM